MEQQVIDRRHNPRFAASVHGGVRATLRPGCVVLLVDISAGGTLVEAPRPLRPGASVHLRVTTAGRAIAVTAHVLRCMVWSIDPLEGVRYRGALKFDRNVDWGLTNAGR